MKKWDPFKDIFVLRERANRLFEYGAPKSIRFGDAGTGVWLPAVDIYETEEAFVVKAELPEVLEADLNITVEDNALTISGERKPRREGKSYCQIDSDFRRLFPWMLAGARRQAARGGPW